MNRKWWKFLLPLPFIFFYCYCVSFPSRGEKDEVHFFTPSQPEPQVIQDQDSPRKAKTAEPPPPPPTSQGAQSPPEMTEKPVVPVPESPVTGEQEILPVESEFPKLGESESVPQQGGTRSAMPPPTSSQTPSVSPPAFVLPDPTPAAEYESTVDTEQALLALAALSSIEQVNDEPEENDNEVEIEQDEKASVIHIVEEVPEPPPPPVEPVKKQDPNEYKRSTKKVSVSQETFQADKRRILSLIADLDVYMATGDYKGWLTCLSDESRTYWSKPQNLRKAASKLPVSGVKLNGMEDYFNYVFVPARMGHSVEEIRYVTETQVKAVQVENNVDMVFYHFKKVDGKWKLFLPKIKD